MAELTLEVIAGPGAGQRFDITGPTDVGRANDVGITLDDAAVSSRHLRLTPAGEGVNVEALGSRNGTWVNGARLTAPAYLTSGYQFTVGMVTMRVLVGEAANAPSSTIDLAAFSPSISIGFKPVEAPATVGAPVASGDLTDELLTTAVWTDDMVARAGIPIVDVPMVSIGGGIGS